MTYYFIWEWQKIKFDKTTAGQKVLSLIQRVIFPQIDKMMVEMEGLKKRDLPSDEWERRYIYKETDSKEEVEVLKEKLKNVGFNKINEVINKAKNGHYRLLPRKVREKLSTIERDDEKTPLEKASSWLITIGIFWDYRICSEQEYKELTEET